MESMKSVPALLGLFGVLASCAMACASPTESADADSDPASSEDAVVTARTQCSTAAYNKAFAHYKKAVAGAKLRATDVCSDGAMLYDIAGELASAVSTCGQFKTVIATSQWAQPVRDALKGNLALASVDGRLAIKDANGKVSLAGLDKALPGTTVFGPAPGVYGNMSKITFAAGGVATVANLQLSDDGQASWKNTPARYKVGALVDGAVEITIESGGRSTVYKASPEPGNAYELLLKPKAGGDEFRSMPSECEA